MLGFSLKQVGLRWNRNGLIILASSPLVQPAQFTIELEDDVARISAFLGIDLSQWRKGFPNTTALYDFLSRCSLFRFTPVRSLLRKLALNGGGERPIIAGFFKHAATVLRLDEESGQPLDLRDWHAEVVTHFGKQHQLDEKMQVHERRKRFSERFNGKIVAAITELSGRELGDFIARLKGGRTDTEFQTFILEQCPNVEDWIRKGHSNE